MGAMVVFGFVIWIVVLGGGLLALGLSANAVWRAVMPPAGLPRGAGCGSCYYELTTLAGERCPECGADLIKAGITTRRNAVRTAGSLPAALMGWTILVIAFFGIISSVISFAAMMGSGGVMNSGYSSTYTFAPPAVRDQDTGGMRPDMGFQVTVAVDVTTNWTGPATSGVITATLFTADSEVSIEYPDASQPAYTITASDGLELDSGSVLDESAIASAFASIGIDEFTHPNADTYMKQTRTLLDTAQQNPTGFEWAAVATFMNDPVQMQQTGGAVGAAGFTPTPMTSAAMLIPLITIGLAILIWALGTAFIIRRRSKLLRPFQPSSAA